MYMPTCNLWHERVNCNFVHVAVVWMLKHSPIVTCVGDPLPGEV